ncbi:MAG: metallophosphoesterase family protein [Anaerolineales bacterium]|nr:metallophosphoesterase family protein [Anaerolineales bacterium]
MRILVFSDIHGNFVALEAVLADAGEIDTYWFLGDLVGYGPNPNECVDRVSQLPNLICLLGNHDAAAVDQIDVETFNPEARISLEWTQDQLTAEHSAYLEDLPLVYADDLVTLAHGSPRSPVFEYLLDNQMATENFPHFFTPFCFVGHTHLPSIFQMANGDPFARLSIPKANTEFVLEPRTIINPGSVGQPRDRDPRAAYAIFDTETALWDYRRVDYDVVEVQSRMRKAGLPERHSLRLEIGW